MKLATRVSVFFLATLAAVLAIYSLVFYSAGRQHIEYQFVEELQGVLNSLVAAAEVEDTEVKWQPLEHSVALGGNNEFGALDWIVIGDRNLVVEHSVDADESFRTRALSFAQANLAAGSIHSRFEPQQQRQYFCQSLIAPHPAAIEREMDEFDEILFVVSRSTIPRNAILNRLALLATVLPILAWSLAAILGRWIVRKALLPVSNMAAQARSIGGIDFQTRLKVTDSGDELSDLGTAFNLLLDRQQLAMGQQQRFAGDAAHESAHSLTVLLGEIDVSLRRQRTESEYLESMKKLRSQAASLQEVVETLLFLARSARDAIVLSTEPIELGKWIQEHRETWRPWPRSGDLQVQSQLPHDVKVMATSPLLSRVLDNLVSNACKYSEPGTPVVIKAEAKASEAIISVCDWGAGIASEDLPHVFEPFFRSVAARRAGKAGTGLGLAIAQRIATTLHGTLECRSSSGQGSCFTLRLPTREDLSSESASVL